MILKTLYPPIPVIYLTTEEETALWKAVKAANGKPFKFQDLTIDHFRQGSDGHEDKLLIHGETRARTICYLEESH